MKFFSQWNRAARKQEAFTNREQIIYKERTNPKTGIRELVEKERVDIVDKINEYKDEVTLSNMLQRYRLDLASQVRNDEERFIDLSQLPENLIETMSVIDNAKELWDNSSVQLKKEFNNNFREFLAGTENGKLVEIVNKHTKQTNPITGEESPDKYSQPEFMSYKDIMTQVQKQNETIANLQKSITKPEVNE